MAATGPNAAQRKPRCSSTAHGRATEPRWSSPSRSRPTRPHSAAPSGSRCSACCRSEEHTSELQSLMRISYAVFCLKKKKINLTKVTPVDFHTTSLETVEDLHILLHATLSMIYTRRTAS